MKQKVRISTKDIITCLIQDKLRLQKSNEEKDLIINSLKNELREYRESVGENAV